MTDKTGGDMTDEELGAKLFFGILGIRAHSDTCKRVGDEIRALFPRPVVATREGVPSVEEVMQTMIEAVPNRWAVGDNGKIMAVDVFQSARVAHAMMLEIAPRQKMMIEGMTEDAISNYIKRDPLWISSGVPGSQAAGNIAYRLANTPVGAVDPDAGAKAAYMRYCTASDHFPTEWRDIPEKYRNGWRAVASAKKVV